MIKVGKNQVYKRNLSNYLGLMLYINKEKKYNKILIILFSYLKDV